MLNVGEGRVGEEEGGMVRADQNAGKGTFAVEGAGGGLEGQDGLHVLYLVSGMGLRGKTRKSGLRSNGQREAYVRRLFEPVWVLFVEGRIPQPRLG